MYHPQQRDNSALFELALAEQLRERNPAFVVGKVDLSPFMPLKAKIDCLTIQDRKVISHGEVKALQSALKGKVARPNDRPKTVTIHDPAFADLKHLVANYPDARIVY